MIGEKVYGRLQPGGCEEDYRGTGIKVSPALQKRMRHVSGIRYVTHLLWGHIPTSHKPLPRQNPARECGKYSDDRLSSVFLLGIPRRSSGSVPARGVAITFVHVDHHFLGRYFESLRHSGNDTLVSLMRNHPVNLFLSQNGFWR